MDEDVSAFCARMRPRLIGALALHCGDIDVAEELAQEALVRVWDRWSSVRTTASPEGWTHRVAFNLAHSLYRRRAAERRARERAGRVAAAAPEPDQADALAVRAAVAALPPRQRTALVLRYFSDLSIADTAIAMRCAEGTVKSLTAQALAALRPKLALEESHVLKQRSGRTPDVLKQRSGRTPDVLKQRSGRTPDGT